MLAAFTEAERVVIEDYDALTGQLMSMSSVLERYASTNWLLYFKTGSVVKIPLFQFEVNAEGALVPTGVIQSVNRILRKTRSMPEIIIWWLAAHEFFSEFPDSNGQLRQTSPLVALTDPRLSECLIGAANRTVARDVTITISVSV